NISKKLHFLYIDTGAMYRAITLRALEKDVNLNNTRVLTDIARYSRIELSANSSGTQRIFLDGKDVTYKIRTPQLTKCVSYIARVKGIREYMVKLQRRLAKETNSVLEGRDIGTVVFPDANIKFYLDASFKERAKRRFKELKTHNPHIKLRDVEEDVEVRDRRDLTRRYAPLKKARDAIYVDTTNLSIREVTDRLLGIINPKLHLFRRGIGCKVLHEKSRGIPLHRHPTCRQAGG
ncbi:MAG: (d)CMP kinase, partial [Candidatus Omnitrophica bacterium]|nr:(d)CMP kinase [Candidatus Omnitrophota bacterium]